MVKQVTIGFVTPDGAKAPKGIELQVVISYPEGEGNTKRFRFFIISGFKSDPVFYALPTEIGCTEELSRQQIANAVRDLKLGNVAPRNSFHAFLESLGREEAEAFLKTFEEWYKEWYKEWYEKNK